MSEATTTNNITAPSVRVETQDISGDIHGGVIVRSWVSDAIDANWIDLIRVAFLIGCGLVGGVIFPISASSVIGDLFRWITP